MTRAVSGQIAPRDGGSAGTDWNRYSLGQMWDMVKTEDGTVTYVQIDAWRRMADLCVEQAEQLERATAQLLEKWPARPGSASEAFRQQITTLVTSMRGAAQAATGNQEPLRNITSVLTDARISIAALMDAHRKYALVEQQLTPHPIPSPGEIPPPAAPVGLQPPPRDWRVQLQQQAVAVMSHADSTVGLEADRIQSPELYILYGSFDNSMPLDTGGSEAFPPPIPLNSGGSNIYNVSPSTQTGTSFSPTDHPTNSSIEPILAGGRYVDSASGQQRFNDPVELSGTPLPRSATSPPYAIPNASEGGTIETEPSHVSRSMASYALPTTGPAQPKPTATSTTVGAPMMPVAAPRSGRTSPTPTAAGRLGRVRSRDRRRSSGDSDDPWFVADGGPAVLEASPDRHNHDPGPGVFGLDR